MDSKTAPPVNLPLSIIAAMDSSAVQSSRTQRSLQERLSPHDLQAMSEDWAAAADNETDQNLSIGEDEFWQQEAERTLLEEMDEIAYFASLAPQGTVSYSTLLAAGA